MRDIQPIGAVLTIGRKGPKGFPVEKDRFHLVLPHEGPDGRRAAHPRYVRFNTADPEHRRSLVCQIVHSDPEQALEYYLSAYRGRRGDPTHPAGAPFCRGDGDRAQRYTGADSDPDGFASIDCAGSECPYQTATPPLCRPFARLAFRVEFKPGSAMPSTICRYQTKSWHTVANLAGFFDMLRDAADLVGAPFVPAGFRFCLQLEIRKSKMNGGSRFPVVRAIPLDDPYSFFAARSAAAPVADDNHALPDPAFGALPDGGKETG